MSIKELLFSLKYKREGDAYYYWKVGLMARAGYNAKHYPKTPEEASPELFEKKKSAKMPDWLKEDYAKRLNEKYRRKE
jgi:hypothetical protein